MGSVPDDCYYNVLLLLYVAATWMPCSLSCNRPLHGDWVKGQQGFSTHLTISSVTHFHNLPLHEETPHTLLNPQGVQNDFGLFPLGVLLFS